MGLLTSRADEQSEALVTSTLESLSYAVTHLSETSERLATGVVNNVLEAGTRVVDTAGSGIMFSFQATCGSLVIRNPANTTLTIAAGQGPGVRPISGPGVHFVEGRSWRSVPINARYFTVYSAASASFAYEAYTNRVAPSGGALGQPAVTGATTSGTDPAAGAEASVTVPAGDNWTLTSALISLVTDATVANRRVHLIIDDGTTTVLNLVGSVDQAASLTVVYSWTAGGNDSAAVRDGVLNLGQLPTDLRLLPGWRIRTLTTGLQAGDNYGPLIVTYTRTAV